MRRIFELPPEPFPDFVVGLCCPCCGIIQESIELDKRLGPGARVARKVALNYVDTPTRTVAPVFRYRMGGSKHAHEEERLNGQGFGMPGDFATGSEDGKYVCIATLGHPLESPQLSNHLEDASVRM